ncbi:hypothetical protein GGS24DRAFT_507831 [Hypoxylon argillaceum]|nr:hypothetical protein GGS24DRAFT_507831 [Hypoxylon argillaceum]
MLDIATTPFDVYGLLGDAIMSPPRRALIAVTSAHATLFQGKETTGLFISEALHLFQVLRAAGFEVDLALETGSYTPDWLSQQPDFLNGDDLTTFSRLWKLDFLFLARFQI